MWRPLARRGFFYTDPKNLACLLMPRGKSPGQSGNSGACSCRVGGISLRGDLFCGGVAGGLFGGCPRAVRDSGSAAPLAARSALGGAVVRIVCRPERVAAVAAAG